MNDSISVVLPVLNAQATLSRDVRELLEVLPELSNEFEILVIDDGSADNTEDVAMELVQEFPQVRFVNLLRRMGRGIAIRTGIQRTQNEVIFVLDSTGPFSSSDLHRLWQLRDDPRMVMARSDNPSPLNTDSIHRVMEWGTQLQQNAEQDGGSGIQMIRRQAVLNLSEVTPDEPIQVSNTRVDNGGFTTDTPAILRRLRQFTSRSN